MDAADRIPADLEGFTAAEAVEAMSRRMLIDGKALLKDLRQARIDQRIQHHLTTWDELNAKSAKHSGPSWLRIHDNIGRHMAAIDHLKEITP